MACTGRFIYTPAAGKIRGLRPTIRERIRKWFRRREPQYIQMITDYQYTVYPSGYKK